MIMEDKIKSMGSYVVAAVVAGYISGIFNEPFIGLAISLIFGGIATYILKMKFAPEEGFKWALGNGLGTYFFVWYVVFTIFFNIGV